jgi:hypothetical protein
MSSSWFDWLHKCAIRVSTPIMGKTNVLFAMANTDQKLILNLEHEFRDTEKAVKGATLRSSIKFIPKLALRYCDLSGFLEEEKPQIFHFTGHGEYILNDIPVPGGNTIPGGPRIYVCTDYPNQNDHLTPSTLITTLNAAKIKVRLVILNACDSKEFAKELVDGHNGVDVCIATNIKIKDKPAIAYSSAFYKELAYGKTIRHAHDQGFLAAQGEDSKLNCGDIVICHRKGCNPDKIRLVKFPKLRWTLIALVLVLLIGFVARRIDFRKDHPNGNIDINVTRGNDVNNQSGKTDEEKQLDMWLKWCALAGRDPSTQALLIVCTKKKFEENYTTFEVGFKFDLCKASVKDVLIGHAVAFIKNNDDRICRQMKVNCPSGSREGTILLEKPNKGESLLLLLEVSSEKGGLSILQGTQYGLTLTKGSKRKRAS